MQTQNSTQTRAQKIAQQAPQSTVFPPRIDSLDLLRGIALLGILLINIVGMGAPHAVLENPTAAGPFTPINQVAWAGVYIFAQQKFIAIFAMLFGAGILLMHESAQRRGLAPKSLHYKRMGWLALFGILHAWFLWYGDILLTYAVAGCLAWLWRHQSALRLAIWGVIIYLIPALLMAFIQASIGQFNEATIAAMTADWAPSATAIAQEVNAVTGGLNALWEERGGLILSLQTDALFMGSLWLALGYMLIGMALFKFGVLSASLSAHAYRRLAWLAVPGLAISAYSVYFRYQDGFSFEHSMFLPMVWHQAGSLLTAVGYVAVFMLCFQVKFAIGLQHRLRAVGRLAFSFYIMHSVLAVILFNWIGLFGQLQRFQLILIALAIWALQLWLGPKYLARYRQGPLEFVWRKLTYGKVKTA